VLFYDNLAPTPCANVNPAMVEVERIYCFAFDHFGEREWLVLDAIYRRLPGDCRESRGPVWWWFGTDEESPPFLSASVEPPGLQVYGILPLASWVQWDAAFRAALEAACLPFRVSTVSTQRL